MRILGIDYGKRRLGLALSDPTGLIASGLATLDVTTDEKSIEELKAIVRLHSVDAVVIGLPRSLDGQLGQAAQEVLQFKDKLAEALHMPVHTWDERMTTVIAERAMLEADVSRSKRKKKVDRIAAQIILQGFLNFLKRKEKEESRIDADDKRQ